MPLQKSLADNAVVDLKPLSANARKSIEAAIKDFQEPIEGVDSNALAEGLRARRRDFETGTWVVGMLGRTMA